MENYILPKKALLSWAIHFRRNSLTLIHRQQFRSTIIHKHEYFVSKIYPKNYMFFMQNKNNKHYTLQYYELFFHTQRAFQDYLQMNYISFMHQSNMIQKQYFKSHPTKAKQYLFSLLGGKETMEFIQRFFSDQLTWKERTLLNYTDHSLLKEQRVSEKLHNKEVVLKELVHHYRSEPIRVKEEYILKEKEQTVQKEQYVKENEILYEISEEDLARIIDEVYEKISYRMKLKSYYGG